MPFASSLAALIITCKDLEASVRLYRAVGVDLKEARHSGPLHYTASLGGVHFALHPTDGVPREAQSGAQVALLVNDLEASLGAARALGAPVLQTPAPRPFGVSAVIEDPDGRRLELVAMRIEMTGPMPR
jgi:lactoylglutathione lyase